jgi:peptidyl-prolyl cis-trans isomerase C
VIRASRLLLLALAVASLLLVAAGCGSATPDAATVGDTQIARSDFEDELQILVDNEQFRTQQLGPDAASGSTVDVRLSAAWLQNLVYQQVVDDEFDRRELEVTDDDRQQARATMESSFGAEVFAEFPESFQDLMVERTARFDVLAADLAGPPPTDEDARAYFEDNIDTYEAQCPTDTGVSHILVETLDEANAIEAELEGGADFATLAQQRSTDTGSGANGGALGCLAPGQFVPEFEEAALAATPGTPTAPVQSEFGYHVILVETPYVTYENFAAQVAQELVSERTALTTFFDETFGDLDIEVDPRYGKWIVDESGPRVEPPDVPSARDGRETEPSAPVPTSVAPAG